MGTARPSFVPRIARLWIACGIMAVGTLVTAIVARQSSLAGAIPAAALITAVSVLAVAALMAPLTPYPRWSHWLGAAVLAAWAVASPLLVSDSARWRTDVYPLLWFMPCFVLTGATMRRRLQGACATEGRRAGWMMVAASVVLGGILIFTERLGRML